MIDYSQFQYSKPTKKIRLANDKLVTKKTLKKAADDLWAAVIKRRDKMCIWCRVRPAVQAHHIFKRSLPSTRHDPENGIGLCGGCHMKAHSDHSLFEDFLKVRMGESRYFILKARAYVPQSHTDHQMRIIELKKYQESLTLGMKE